MLNFVLIIRAVQALFALLVLAISAAAIHYFGISLNPLNFLLFCGIWALLALAYLLLAPVKFPALHNVFVIIAVEAVTMIFFFAGFIAVAADINSWCSLFVDNVFDTTFVSFYPKKACDCSKAATAFGAFSWLLWTATTILVVRQFWLDRQASVQNVAPVQDNKDGGIQMQSNPNV